MKRRLLAVVMAALVAAGIIYEVWWARRFDDQEAS